MEMGQAPVLHVPVAAGHKLSRPVAQLVVHRLDLNAALRSKYIAYPSDKVRRISLGAKADPAAATAPRRLEHQSPVKLVHESLDLLLFCTKPRLAAQTAVEDIAKAGQYAHSRLAR